MSFLLIFDIELQMVKGLNKMAFVFLVDFLSVGHTADNFSVFFALHLRYRATEEQRGKRYPIKIISPIKSKLFGEVCDIEKFVVRKLFLFLLIKH